MSPAVTAPHVYRAINAITAAMAKNGIPKAHLNQEDQYAYRSIDDVLGRLAPLLAKHRLCALPRVIDREAVERSDEAGAALLNVVVTVAYDLVSCRDGSRHTIQASGEALDASDKATAKAISAAYKSAMLQTFCIPVSGGDDADAASKRLRRRVAETEPVQGWEAWAEDIVDMIKGCETSAALDLMRSRHTAMLVAISRERAELYGKIGASFAYRLRELGKSPPSKPASRNRTSAEERTGALTAVKIDA